MIAFGGRETAEQPVDERWASESQLPTGEEPRLLWFGGILVIIFLVVAFAILANPMGWLNVGLSTPALATRQEVVLAPDSNRTTCEEFELGGDLRSPEEGVWFQGHCLSKVPLAADFVAPACRRTSTDAPEFRQIAPDLYVFVQSHGSASFLWHSSADGCYDLVSSRVVTAICANGAISFDWNEQSVCSDHGGVFAWINGP